MELHHYLYVFLIFSTMSLVYSQSNTTSSPYSVLGNGAAPSTYSGFFEFLFPFYVGCKWFYNSLLSANGLNQILINRT